jgi:hypothetical protein
MRTNSIDRVSEQRERNPSAKAEAEQVIREIGITVAILLSLAVLAQLLIPGG